VCVYMFVCVWCTYLCTCVSKFVLIIYLCTCVFMFVCYWSFFASRVWTVGISGVSALILYIVWLYYFELIGWLGYAWMRVFQEVCLESSSNLIGCGFRATLLAGESEWSDKLGILSNPIGWLGFASIHVILEGTGLLLILRNVIDWEFWVISLTGVFD
jgi:hypothetical protein